jgi:hypothetical protein
MKSAWTGIGFSHHKVPSLSKTATRSVGGTPADTVRSANSTTARLAAPSLQLSKILVTFDTDLLFADEDAFGST